MAYEEYKQVLEKELESITEELKTVGRINPANSQDWEPTEGEHSVENPAEPGEQADHIEEFEERTAILKELETRWNEVKTALERIDNNTYGTCEVCGEEIQKERLDANPAAQTCSKHMN